MGRRRALAALVGLSLAMTASAAGAGARPVPGPGGSRLVPVPTAALPGWADDDHAAAFATFLRTCRVVADGTAVLRPGLAPPPALVALCADALATGPLPADDARRFFEDRFTAWRIDPPGPGTDGFLTGYYEPVVEGSLVRAPGFPVPVLARPADLETFPQGATPPGLDPALAAARRTATGHEPFPDRAAIQDGALDGQGLEIAWLRDEVELFMAQVQGSARLRLPDGRLLRLVYAGRNGHPYTSIGRVIVAERHMDLETMTLARLKGWLRDNPAAARRIMRLNRSYIFFAIGEGMDPADGPIGAASVPLTPLRSIAVDRTLWPYGLPVYIAATLPDGRGQTAPFARLMVAQDTGSAILGPARADIYCGTGDEAGVRAGGIRHPGRFHILLPRGWTP